VHALIWGNGYAFIDRTGSGDALGLYPLMPDRTKPLRDKGNLYFVTETKRPDGSPWLRPIPQVDVLHVQGLSTDGLKGCDLVAQARNSWALGLAAQKFASRFFASGGRTGGVLEVPINTTVEYQDALERGFRNVYEKDNGWFKTVVLRDGAKFHSAAFNPDESQMTETRNEQALEVCRWFNLPPSKLGIPGSVSYNSQSESNQAYLDSTLDP
jgi:HK97 family phage portal protein